MRTKCCSLSNICAIAANPIIFLLGIIFFIEVFIGLMIIIYIGRVEGNELYYNLPFWIFMTQAAASLIIWLAYVLSAADTRAKILNDG